MTRGYEKRRAEMRRAVSGYRKSPLDFFDSLNNASLFVCFAAQKSCRFAAQTPAAAGFLQAFDSTRGGSRPLVLPLRNKTLFLQTEVLRQAETARRDAARRFYFAASLGPGRNSSPAAAISRPPADSSVNLPENASAPPAGKAARRVMPAP